MVENSFEGWRERLAEFEEREAMFASLEIVRLASFGELNPGKGYARHLKLMERVPTDPEVRAAFKLLAFGDGLERRLGAELFLPRVSENDPDAGSFCCIVESVSFGDFTPHALNGYIRRERRGAKHGFVLSEAFARTFLAMDIDVRFANLRHNGLTLEELKRLYAVATAWIDALSIGARKLAALLRQFREIRGSDIREVPKLLGAEHRRHLCALLEWIEEAIERGADRCAHRDERELLDGLFDPSVAFVLAAPETEAAEGDAEVLDLFQEFAPRGRPSECDELTTESEPPGITGMTADAQAAPEQHAVHDKDCELARDGSWFQFQGEEKSFLEPTKARLLQFIIAQDGQWVEKGDATQHLGIKSGARWTELMRMGPRQSYVLIEAGVVEQSTQVNEKTSRRERRYRLKNRPGVRVVDS